MKREPNQKVLLHGTEAICEGALRNGCRAFFGYPITPQNEVPEYMSVKMPQLGGVFVQAESEVAAINMVYGAAGSGVRAMTSSSSPGVSLKQEGISYIACARIPGVIVNIMRAGPGLGGILPAQGDYFQAVKGGGHDSALAVQKMQEFFWKDGAPANYDPSQIPRTQDLAPFYMETCGMYVYTAALMKGEGRRIGHSPCLVEVSKIEGVDINDAEDFMIADAVSSLFQNNGEGF